MFCENCGMNIPDNHQFCPKCGTPRRGGGYGKVITKTRLGISTAEMGALVYVAGLVSPVVLTLMVGYILLMENDKNLKADALKSGVLYVVFLGLSLIMDILQDLMNVLGVMVNWFSGTYMGFPLSLNVIYLNVLNVANIIIVAAAAFMTFSGKKFSIKPVDSYVEMHL